MNTHTLRFTRFLVCAAALSVSSAYAATVTWDASPDVGFQASSGTWGTNAAWSTNGTNLTSWVAGDAAAFLSSTAGDFTINLGSAQSISGLSFGGVGSAACNWSLTGSGLSMAADTIINVYQGSAQQSSTVNLGVAISGANKLTKAGAGTLELSAANALTGSAAVNAGMLVLSHGGALGTGGFYSAASTTVSAGATLALKGGISIPELILLSGSGVDGLGALRSLSGANTLTTQVRFADPSVIGVDAGSKLTVSGGNLYGPGSMTKVGAGELVVGVLCDYVGGTTVHSGTLRIANVKALGTGAVSVIGGTLNLATYAVANTVTLTDGTLLGSQLNADKLVLQGGEVAGVVVSGALTKTGAGSVALSGANTYAGGTTISAGTLILNHASALGAGGVTLAGGALDVQGQTVAKTIALTGNSSVLGSNGTITGVISGNGLLSKDGVGLLTLSGNNDFTGGMRVNAGTLQVKGEVLGNLFVAGGAALAGSGVVHDVTVVAGGALQAGGVNAIGTLRADSINLQGGSRLEVNFANASLGSGSGYDSFLLSGQLDVSSVSLNNKLTLSLAGTPVVFDAAGNYSFGLLKYGSLNLGANTSISELFVLDVSGLRDQTGAGLDASRFSLVNDAANQQLLVSYSSPVPEPSTYGLGLGVLSLAAVALRRRKIVRRP